MSPRAGSSRAATRPAPPDMTAIAEVSPAVAPPPPTLQICDELDRARRKGPLQQIRIPPCPEALTRLQQLMLSPEPDLTAIGAIADGDVAIAATLIRRANSPLFTAGAPITSVGQAMNRLGLHETVQLMTGVLVQGAVPTSSRHLKRFWELSARRAAAMGYIATQLPGMAPEMAHTYGLFCHVGMPVMMQCVSGYGSTIVEGEARIDRSFVATENANHKADHAVVGALVCRTWRMAPALVAAVRLHHDLPTLGQRGVEPEVQTLVAAGLIAEHLMRRIEGLPADREWKDHCAAAMEWLSIEPTDLEVWEPEIQLVFDSL